MRCEVVRDEMRTVRKILNGQPVRIPTRYHCIDYQTLEGSCSAARGVNQLVGMMIVCFDRMRRH